MELKKCVRCGCFFASSTDTCPNCKNYDENDIVNLKNYLQNNEIPESVQSLSYKTGIDIKNINRYLQKEEFLNVKKVFSKPNKNILNNPSISL